MSGRFGPDFPRKFCMECLCGRTRFRLDCFHLNFDFAISSPPPHGSFRPYREEDSARSTPEKLAKILHFCVPFPKNHPAQTVCDIDGLPYLFDSTGILDLCVAAPGQDRGRMNADVGMDWAAHGSEDLKNTVAGFQLYPRLAATLKFARDLPISSL